MDELLRKVQLTELEILKTVDKICRKNNIKYSLCGGTLLGAVRHKGFIPWDDDIDIAMRRDDYNRFLEIWKNSHPEGYVLQNKNNTPSFSQTFSKIRKDKTTFLQFENEAGLYHTGIFIDIFPFDRIPDNKLKKKTFLLRSIIYLIYVRRNDHSLKNKALARIAALIYRCSSETTKKKYCERFIKSLEKSNNNMQLNYVSVDSVSSAKKEFLPSLCDEYTTIEFEGKQFMCFKDWENYLSVFYGNYMQLPPVEERTWTHHPIIIDFEHNYEELECAKQ